MNTVTVRQNSLLMARVSPIHPVLTIEQDNGETRIIKFSEHKESTFKTRKESWNLPTSLVVG